MSMHKTPLTTIEESGLRAHGLDIGTPSQLSDAFRQGVSWGQKAPPEKRAPVQGWPDGIPWSLHMEAYAAYSKKWAPQAALIDLEGRNCRGGFSTGELDEFIPGWKDKVSEIHKLRTEINRLQAALHRAMQAKTMKQLDGLKAPTKDLPPGTCADCDGDGEQGGQFCGGLLDLRNVRRDRQFSQRLSAVAAKPSLATKG